jgi:hypothetical protein
MILTLFWQSALSLNSPPAQLAGSANSPVFFGGSTMDCLGVTFKIELFWNQAVGTCECMVTTITADDVASSTVSRYSHSAYGAFTKAFSAIHAFAKANGFVEQLNMNKAAPADEMELPF